MRGGRSFRSHLPLKGLERPLPGFLILILSMCCNWGLETKIGGGAEAEAGDIWVVEVGVSFNQVEAEGGEDIIDTDAGFEVGLAAEGVGGVEALWHGELHL